MAAIPLADIAKEPINASWKTLKSFPADNTEAGLPNSEKVVSNFVSALEIKNGVINMTFGNKVNPKINGKVLSFRPAVIEESQAVPIAWVCGNAKALNQMTVKGENKTTVPVDYLPRLCQ